MGCLLARVPRWLFQLVRCIAAPARNSSPSASVSSGACIHRNIVLHCTCCDEQHVQWSTMFRGCRFPIQGR